MVEARAVQRYIRLSPRRAREVLNLIKGKNADKALNILNFTPKKAAAFALKVLRSAISNAMVKDKEAKPESLVVVSAYAGPGPTLKRFHSRARGRADQIRRRTTHIAIEVSDRSK